MCYCSSKDNQQGYSIVELMISMLIGIFIIGAIISVFIASSKAYTVQQAMTQVQEKGRFALRKLRVDIQKAGYYIDLEESEVAIDWQAVGAVSSYGANASNVLSIYRRGNGGNPATIHRVSYFINGNNLVRNEVVDIASPNPLANEVLISNVARFDLRFGADISSEAGVVGDEITRSIDWIPVSGASGTVFESYLSATQLMSLAEFTATQAWNKVRAVQVELVVASNTNHVVDSPQVIGLTNPFNAVSDAVASGLDVNDRQYFQAYSSTFALRNRVE